MAAPHPNSLPSPPDPISKKSQLPSIRLQRAAAHIHLSLNTGVRSSEEEKLFQNSSDILSRLSEHSRVGLGVGASREPKSERAKTLTPKDIMDFSSLYMEFLQPYKVPKGRRVNGHKSSSGTPPHPRGNFYCLANMGTPPRRQELLASDSPFSCGTPPYYRGNSLSPTSIVAPTLRLLTSVSPSNSDTPHCRQGNSQCVTDKYVPQRLLESVSPFPSLSISPSPPAPDHQYGKITEGKAIDQTGNP